MIFGIDPMYIGFGLVVGILVGLTGIGGGSLMTPLLLLAGGIPPTVAIGTDLAYGAVTKTVGGWRHLRAGTVDLGISKWLAFGSVPGSLLGVWLSERLADHYGEDFGQVLMTAVAGALLLVAGAILFRVYFLPHLAKTERHEVVLDRRTKTAAVSFGVVMGAILGITSVGSGALIGLALILFFRLTPHRVVGTDVFHAAILLWTAALAHGVAGNVDYVLTGTLLLGSVPGVIIGAALLPKVHSDALRPALACVLLAAALGVATKAGFAIPPVLIVALPVLAGVIAWLFHRSRSKAEAAEARQDSDGHDGTGSGAAGSDGGPTPGSSAAQVALAAEATTSAPWDAADPAAEAAAAATEARNEADLLAAAESVRAASTTPSRGAA